MKPRYQLTDDDRRFCEARTCAGAHAIKYHTLALVEDCLDDGIPGDFAECGVMAGAHPAIMLRCLLRRGIRDRRVHLFDSFQGIPRATENDNPPEIATYGLKSGERMEPSGISYSSVANTLGFIRDAGVYDPELVVVHEGWFEETLARDAESISALALLRVDVDLYESTRVVYQHLYDKVSPGGYVIDDDYGTVVTACRRALESVIGPQEVFAAEGQETTSWWRKK